MVNDAIHPQLQAGQVHIGGSWSSLQEQMAGEKGLYRDAQTGMLLPIGTSLSPEQIVDINRASQAGQQQAMLLQPYYQAQQQAQAEAKAHGGYTQEQINAMGKTLQEGGKVYFKPGGADIIPKSQEQLMYSGNVPMESNYKSADFNTYQKYAEALAPQHTKTITRADGSTVAITDIPQEQHTSTGDVYLKYPNQERFLIAQQQRFYPDYMYGQNGEFNSSAQLEAKNLLPEYQNVNIPPSSVMPSAPRKETYYGQQLIPSPQKAGILDVISAPRDILVKGSEYIKGGFTNLLAGKPRELPIIGTKIGETIRKIIPSQELTKLTSVPEKVIVSSPHEVGKVPQTRTIMFGEYQFTPKHLEVVPSTIGYVPPVVSNIGFLAGSYFVPTSVLAPTFMAGGIRTITKAATPEEYLSGALEFGAGALLGGYGAYKYARTPTIKQAEIIGDIKKPSFDISGRTTLRTVQELPTGEKVTIDIFKVRGKEYATQSGFRTIISEKYRDILGMKPIYEGYPYAQPKQYQQALELLKSRAKIPETQARDILVFKRPMSSEITTVGKGISVSGKEQTARFKIRETTLPYSQTLDVVKIGEKYYPIRTRGVSEVKFTDIIQKPATAKDLSGFKVKPVKGVEYFKGIIRSERARLTLEGRPYVKIKEAGKLRTQFDFVTGIKPLKSGKYIDTFETSQISRQIIPAKRGLSISPKSKVSVVKGEPLMTVYKEALIKVKPDITITKPKFGEVKFTEAQANDVTKTLRNIYGKKQVLDLGKLTIAPKVPKLEKLTIPKEVTISKVEPTILPSIYAKTSYGVPVSVKDVVISVPKSRYNLEAFKDYSLRTPGTSEAFGISSKEDITGLPVEGFYLPSETKMSTLSIARLKGMEDLGLGEIGKVKPSESLKPSEQLKPAEMLKPLERLKSTERLKTTERLITTQIKVPRITPRTPETKIPKVPEIIPKLGKQTQTKLGRRISKSGKGLLTVEVRRQGKFKPIVSGVMDIGKAVQIGKIEARRTLAASFRIKSPKGYLSLQPSQEFRRSKSFKDPFSMIQIAPARLSSKTERLEIKQARQGILSLA